MLRKITSVFILFSCFSIMTFASGGGGGTGDEISLMTLDELFDKAAQTWKITPDNIWDLYNTKSIEVTHSEFNKTEYFLDSKQYGKITVALNPAPKVKELTPEEAWNKLSGDQ